MLRTPIFILLCFLGASCASQTKASEVPERPTARGASARAQRSQPKAPVVKPRPWTKAFDKGAVLMGDTIRVQGPPGLSTHSALTVNNELFVLTQEATSQGFLQVLTLRPKAIEQGREQMGSPELRCQMGRWTLVALDRIEVLERPGPCDVVVTAQGSAFWKDVNSKIKRGETLEFRGTEPKE